jgi:hypothetical protein
MGVAFAEPSQAFDTTVEIEKVNMWEHHNTVTVPFFQGVFNRKSGLSHLMAILQFVGIAMARKHFGLREIN